MNDGKRQDAGCKMRDGEGCMLRGAGLVARLVGGRFCSLKAAFPGCGFAAPATVAWRYGGDASPLASLRGEGEDRRTAPTLHRPGGRSVNAWRALENKGDRRVSPPFDGYARLFEEKFQVQGSKFRVVGWELRSCLVKVSQT